MEGQTRILFVDDEAQLLESFRFALRRRQKDWEVHTALDGEQALVELATGPFDIVVSDMRMPGMDGASLLRRVKELQPDAVRLMLSADAGQAALLRTLSVAHQYLQKPRGMGDLRVFLERLRALRGMVGPSAARRIAGELAALPSVPAFYDELSRAAADPATTADDFERVVARDAAMSTKVLQLAGSAFFGTGDAVGSVSAAVWGLGAPLLRGLVAGGEIFEKLERVPDGFEARRLQTESHAVATLSAAIVGDGEAAEVAATAARLRDVGQLILAARLPEPFGKALAIAGAERRPLWQVERELLGTDHAALGGYLLGIWGLPTPLVDAVAHHLHPEEVQPTALDPACAIHLAAALVAEAVEERLNSSARRGAAPLSPALFALAGVQERLPEWRAQARELAVNR